MKRSLLALAVLGAFAGAASAQSSVTLFGVLDVNAQNIKNNSSTQRLSTDGIASSRLGFRGVEDLGGGLRASFHLEAALAPDTGTAGGSNNLSTGAVTNGAGSSALFNRRATVSLLGGFGEVRLGRDYDPTFWNLTNFDPFGTNGVGSSLNMVSTLGSGVGTLVRANNSIGYFLPGNLGGLYGQAMVAAGEGAQAVTGVGAAATPGAGNKYYGGRVGYAAGPFDVAVAYGQTTSFTGEKYKLGNVAGSWDFGVAKIMAQYINAKYDATSTLSGAIGDRKQVNYLLGAVVPVGAGEFHASYDRANQSGAGTGSNDANLMALGYVYNLSKRTALYGNIARIDNKGAQAFSVNGSITGTSLLTGGRDSTGYEVGVRHSF
ncbi:MAG: gram-negative porin family protein [Rhizobacter sp.]|nr:gram-negative porin family protein [Rhizobacter sp.]